MDWTNEESLQFLECYKNEPCIWNPQHTGHKDRKKVADAWKRIEETLNFKWNLNDLKKKKDSLMASFRSLLRKRKSINAGLTGDDIYTPCWFAFEPMEQFLGPLYNLHNPNTEDIFANLLMDTDDHSNVSEVGVLKITENEIENAEFKSGVTKYHTASKISSQNITEMQTGLKITENEVENAKFKSGVTKNHTARKISSQKTSEMQAKLLHRKQEAIVKNIDIEETEKSLELALYHILKDGTTREPVKDDCDFYAAILATKLRRFDVFQREEIMLEIDSYLLKKRRNLTEVVLV